MTAENEHDIWLTPHDMDHLEGGQPVYKGIGEDTLLVLRAGDWDTIQAVRDAGTDTDQDGDP